MSSYEVGGVNVGMALMGGPIVIGAALAVLTPVAAGYGVYKAGITIKDMLVREHQEALERQYREEAQARARMEMEKRIREEIIDKCQRYINELQRDMNNESNDVSKYAKELISKLNVICEKTVRDIDSLEMQNQSDDHHIDELVRSYKAQRDCIISNIKESDRVTSFLCSIDRLFESLTTTDYGFVHDISIKDNEQVQLTKLHSQAEKLIEEFYTCVNREIDRFSNYPISSVEIDRIAILFNNIREEIMALSTEKEKWVIENRIQAISRRMEAYYTDKALLDKEQEKFMNLYLRYKKSFEETGEEYKEAIEFDTYDELEAAVSYRVKQLKRMQYCSELYLKMGHEAYICMAFEMELKRLDYIAESKEMAEHILKQELQYAQMGGKKTPFYKHDNNSVTRIFKAGSNTELQLIIHADGSTTMETIALNDTLENAVREVQKVHCAKSKLLEKALKDNWFITVKYDEQRSSDNISLTFNSVRESEKRCNETSTCDEIQKRKQLEQKERAKRNAKKAKVRSMALHY